MGVPKTDEVIGWVLQTAYLSNLHLIVCPCSVPDLSFLRGLSSYTATATFLNLKQKRKREEVPVYHGKPLTPLPYNIFSGQNSTQKVNKNIPVYTQMQTSILFTYSVYIHKSSPFSFLISYFSDFSFPNPPSHKFHTFSPSSPSRVSLSLIPSFAVTVTLNFSFFWRKKSHHITSYHIKPLKPNLFFVRNPLAPSFSPPISPFLLFFTRSIKLISHISSLPIHIYVLPPPPWSIFLPSSHFTESKSNLKRIKRLRNQSVELNRKEERRKKRVQKKKINRFSPPPPTPIFCCASCFLLLFASSLMWSERIFDGWWMELINSMKRRKKGRKERREKGSSVEYSRGREKRKPDIVTYCG